MNDDSVQIVISGQGPSRVRLEWRGTRPDVRVVVHMSPHAAQYRAPLCPLMPAPCEVPAQATALGAPTPTLSFELRWRQPGPPPIQDVPSEPAPLATAWAAAQRLRQRAASSSTAPRRRTARAPAG